MHSPLKKSHVSPLAQSASLLHPGVGLQLPETH
jgi:hypothetical protein